MLISNDLLLVPILDKCLTEDCRLGVLGLGRIHQVTIMEQIVVYHLGVGLRLILLVDRVLLVRIHFFQKLLADLLLHIL